MQIEELKTAKKIVSYTLRYNFILCDAFSLPIRGGIKNQRKLKDIFLGQIEQFNSAKGKNCFTMALL